jgi:predicted O-methyltransferase YrrM
MKSDLLTDLPVVPEEYDAENYNKQTVFPFCEMTDTERRFIHGLIRYYEPQKLIELGVARGGSTVNIINSIADRPEASLTSIDLADFYYGDKTTPVGDAAKRSFPDLPEGKWNLFSGKDPVELIEKIDTVFDFAVIDTSHILPTEAMNFLTVLPYLRDGAIVVLHDITLYTEILSKQCIGPKILEIAVTAPKLRPKPYDFIFEGNKLVNICAFQINADTRKYIGSVFSALELPWGPKAIPDERLRNVFYDFFNRHYEKEYAEMFMRAALIQNVFRIDFIKLITNALGGREFCLFGAGYNCDLMIKVLIPAGLTPLYILDNNKSLTQKAFGGGALTLNVYSPEYNPKRDAVIIITPEKPEKIIKQLESLGYRKESDYICYNDFYTNTKGYYGN